VKITDTAALIARARDEEGRLPAEQRLFSDPFARLFVGELEQSDVAETFGNVPFLRDQVRIRTRFIDDFVRSGLAEGFRQLVILGSGFDCRGLRLEEIAATGSRVFEVDFAAQLASKREILERAGVAIPGHLRFVGCDFTAERFAAELTADLVTAGFVDGAPTLFTWEGVISYLGPSEVDRMFQWIAATGGPRSRVVFNYSINGFVGNDPDGMSARTRAAGFAALDDRSLGSLYREYCNAEPEHRDVAELFRLAVAVTSC